MTSPLQDLTARQMDILRLVAEGKENKQIADQLVVTLDTVKSTVRNAMHRLGARNRAHLVALAARLGLLATATPGRPSGELLLRAAGLLVAAAQVERQAACTGLADRLDKNAGALRDLVSGAPL